DRTPHPAALGAARLGLAATGRRKRAPISSVRIHMEFLPMLRRFFRARVIAKRNFRNGGRRPAGRRGKPAGLPHHFGNYFWQPVCPSSKSMDFAKRLARCAPPVMSVSRCERVKFTVCLAPTARAKPPP